MQLDGNTIGLIIVGALSLIGSIYAASQARKTNTATVDIRLFKLLQDDVVVMRQEMSALRKELRESQNETDAERKLRIKVEARLTDVERALDRMVRFLDAADMPVPEDYRSLLGKHG